MTGRNFGIHEKHTSPRREKIKAAKLQHRLSSQITCLFNTVVPGLFAFAVVLFCWTAIADYGPIGLAVVAIPVTLCVACIWFLVRLPAVFIDGESIVVKGWLRTRKIPLQDVRQIAEWRIRNGQFVDVRYVGSDGKWLNFRFLASLLAISAREEHPDIAYFRTLCGALSKKEY